MIEVSRVVNAADGAERAPRQQRADRASIPRGAREQHPRHAQTPRGPASTRANGGRDDFKTRPIAISRVHATL